MSTATDAPVEETLAWEAEKRPRISTIAIVGGLLTVTGNILFTVISNGGPTEDDTPPKQSERPGEPMI